MGLFRRGPKPPDASAAMSRVVVLKYQIVTALSLPPPDALAQVMERWSESERESFLRDATELRGRAERTLRGAPCSVWTVRSRDEKED